MGGPKVRGVWVSPTPDLLYGDVKVWAESAGVECARIPGYWIHDKSLKIDTGAPPREGEKVLYHLHGGTYMAFSAHPNDATSRIPRGILEYSRSITRTFSIEYRRTAGRWDAPINSFPAALLDAVAGYHYLVHDVGFDPSDIIIEGDSAGGNLALALVRYILEARDAKLQETLRAPSGLLLLSPWVDMGVRGYEHDSSVYVNIPSDFINLTTPHYALVVRRFAGPLGRQFAEANRFLSPGAESSLAESDYFAGFPRTMIIAGGAEVLFDQIREFYRRLSEDLGENVRYHESPDAMHDFIVVPGHSSESIQALEAIGRWVDSESTA